MLLKKEDRQDLIKILKSLIQLWDEKTLKEKVFKKDLLEKIDKQENQELLNEVRFLIEKKFRNNGWIFFVWEQIKQNETLSNLLKSSLVLIKSVSLKNSEIEKNAN